VLGDGLAALWRAADDLTRLAIERHAAAALTAGATPTLITTTNLPGSLAFSIPVEAAAAGSVYEKIIDPARPIISSAQNTATTIVAGAVTSVIWRITALFYVAPSLQVRRFWQTAVRKVWERQTGLCSSLASSIVVVGPRLPFLGDTRWNQHTKALDVV
jgi:hypothetical protein